MRKYIALLVLLVTSQVSADTFQRFIQVGCWPEIKLMQLEGIVASNVDGYNVSTVEKNYGLYSGSFESNCGQVRVSAKRGEYVAQGRMCGLDPSAELSVWLGKTQILSSAMFGSSCGARYIKSLEVAFDGQIKICMAASPQPQASQSSTINKNQYSFSSRDDDLDCRNLDLNLEKLSTPIDLQELYSDSALAP
jgi:hypothetical protein